MIATDPRINAAPRVSDLHGEARIRVLAARDRTHRDSFMAPYTAPGSLTPAHRSMARSLSAAISYGALVGAAVLLVVMIWRGALSAVLS